MRARAAADYDRLIAKFGPLVKQWKRERRALLSKERLERQRQDPAYIAKLQAAQARAIADPEKNARRIENCRKAARISAGARLLPPMTVAQKSKMYRMRGCGVSREDAIRAILEYSTGASLASPVPLGATPERAREGAERQ